MDMAEKGKAKAAKTKANKNTAKPRRAAVRSVSKTKPAEKSSVKAAKPTRPSSGKAVKKKPAPAKKVTKKTASSTAAPRTGAKAAPKKKAPSRPKASVKTAPAKKNAVKTKASTPKAKAKARPAPAVAKRPARSEKPAFGHKARRLSARDMEFFRRLLLQFRDHVVDGITFLSGDNLNNNQREKSGDLSNYGIHMADHGTDSFDRDMALSMVSSEQDLIYEIDEALARMDSGTYGICEMTGEPIERERLKVLPHARHCVKAQEELERKQSRFRPSPRGADF